MEELHGSPAERRKFMESQGITYLPRTVCMDVPFFSRDQSQSPYYLDNKEEFESLLAEYGEKISQNYMAEVSIRKVSQEIGYGLFCEEDRKAGDFLAEYSGIAGPGKDISPHLDNPAGREAGYESDYSWDYPDPWHEDLVLEINAEKMGNELRYVNHSFKANLAVEHTLMDNNQWVIFFVFQKPVSAGTQLTVDYGEEYWSGGFRELILF